MKSRIRLKAPNYSQIIILTIIKSFQQVRRSPKYIDGFHSLSNNIQLLYPFHYYYYSFLLFYLVNLVPHQCQKEQSNLKSKPYKGSTAQVLHY